MRLLQFLQKLTTPASTHFKKCYNQSARAIYTLWHGATKENPKVVIYNPSIWRALQKCAIHLIPTFIALFLTGVNLRTYFIGDKLSGRTSASWQDFDQLALQVAAKLYEVLTIASLSTILMDVFRYNLLRGSNGLPLGLLAAKTLFADVTFLFSPEFRHGIIGLNTLNKCFLPVLIVVCSAVALLIGPSAALLLIPQVYTDWPAGGATFSLVGAPESLWPSRLDSRFIGGAHCQFPSEDDLARQQLNMSSCIWSGYKPLQERFTSIHLETSAGSLPIDDGRVERNLVFQYYIASAAAYAIPLAVGFYSTILAFIWDDSVKNAPSTRPGSLTPLSNLLYRDLYGTKCSIKSQMPVVRTSCITNASVPFAEIVDQTYYPLQPEYPKAYLESVVANGGKYDSKAVLGKAYSFNTSMYVNSSRVAAIWLETPLDESIGTLINGTEVTGRSSAYLNIQIPSPNNSIGIHVGCSIDARWVESAIVGSQIAQVNADPYYEAPWISFADSLVFPAVDDGTWRTVRLGLDWLLILTPELDNSSGVGWNSLASIIADMGLDNSTGLISAWDAINEAIAPLVSAVVVDGMSRVGYEKNGGVNNHTFAFFPWTQIAPQLSAAAEPIVHGKFKLPDIYIDDGNATDRTELRWSVTVTGLGYRTYTTSFYLAIAVLLVHVALAFAHTCWVLYKRETSTAWSSLNDLLNLALVSEPPNSGFENTTVGIERFETLRNQVRIRISNKRQSNTDPATDHGSVGLLCDLQIIVGATSQDKYKVVAPGQKY